MKKENGSTYRTYLEKEFHSLGVRQGAGGLEGLQLVGRLADLEHVRRCRVAVQFEMLKLKST